MNLEPFNALRDHARFPKTCSGGPEVLERFSELASKQKMSRVVFALLAVAASANAAAPPSAGFAPRSSIRLATVAAPMRLRGGADMAESATGARSPFCSRPRRSTGAVCRVARPFRALSQECVPFLPLRLPWTPEGLALRWLPGVCPAGRYKRYSSQFKNNHFTEMCGGTEAGSYLRLIDSCISQLTVHGPSRTCNESKEEVCPAMLDDDTWQMPRPAQGSDG